MGSGGIFCYLFSHRRLMVVFECIMDAAQLDRGFMDRRQNRLSETGGLDHYQRPAGRQPCFDLYHQPIYSTSW